MGVLAAMGSAFSSNDDLGKKDDDHQKPSKMAPSIRPQWTAAATGGARRKTLIKRLAIVFSLGLFAYLFVSNLPTDVPIRDHRHPVYHAGGSPGQLRGPGPAPGGMPRLRPGRKPQRPKPPPPKPHAHGPPASAEPADPVMPVVPPTAGYNGPLTFPKLLTSLESITSTGGYQASNKNVLFAAASLKSAGLLLPLACQMGGELRNYVHFALIGGTDIDLDELRVLNGVDESCQVIFHDARPDLATSSATQRLKLSSSRALYHINNYMHPQAVIIDASGNEEDYFLAGIRSEAPTLPVPLLELPDNAHSRLAWITKLDSSSLAAWDKISIDILIHALPGTSGSITHLLKSLSAADFSAGSTPHLTIELPHDIDRATTEFLKDFQWPPGRSLLSSHPRQLTLRHRIPRERLTEEESSVRFLESFWPSNSKYSHVLVLSPQMQLSPQFYLYVKYAALQYLYSGPALVQEWDSRLFGVSLNLPSTHLDGTKPFTPPSRNAAGESPQPDVRGSTPFLWQAPNSNAALFTGQKWMELHALVSNLLEHQHRTASSPSAFFTDKLVSKRYPSWLEHALRLARARGYWMLYPSEEMVRNLATVHSELYRAPEEYERELARETLAGSVESPLSGGGNLFESLPDRGRLLSFDEMPLLHWNGHVTGLRELDDASADYARDFRRVVGGCGALSPEDLAPRPSMKDLFCMKDDE